MRTLLLLTSLAACGRSTLPPPESPVAPAALSYGRSWVAAMRGESMLLGPLAPEVLGGQPSEFSVSPNLLPGLVLDTTTGVLSGTPTLVVSPASTFEITATNLAGSVSTQLAIEVLDGYVVDSTADAEATGSTIDERCASDHDGNTGTPEVCTLRAAIDEAQSSGGRRIIAVPAAVYPITLGQLALSSRLVVAGMGGEATLDGSFNGDNRAAIVYDQVSLQDLVFRNFEVETHGYVMRVSGPGAHLRASHITVSDSTSVGFDGALYATLDSAVTLEQCAFRDNVSQDDAAIWVTRGVTLDIDACTFEGNRATRWAMVTVGQHAEPSSITGCTFANNTANLRSGLQILTGAEVTATNNTFVANTADSGEGGAIYFAGDLLRLHHNTFVDNNADSRGDTLWLQFGTVELFGNLFARASDHCAGTTTTLGGNVSDTDATDCALGAADQAGVASIDLLMAELGDHGGPVKTVAIDPSSAAIDAATDCPATDARGLPRSLPCDAGAFEVQPFD